MARPSVVEDHLSLPSRLRRFASDRQVRLSPRQKLALGAFLFLFFGVYLLALVGTATIAGAMTFRLVTGTVAPLTGGLVATGAASATAILIVLARGLADTATISGDESIELTRGDQPQLFAFVDNLCERTGASFPDRIVARPDVNAGVFVKYSVWNPFRPMEKQLLIGLGLINILNRTELEAVLAHEMGHFSQRSLWMHHHARLADNLLSELLGGCDAIESFATRWRRSGVPGDLAARLLVALAVVFRRGWTNVRDLLERLESAVSRQMELQADRFAVETAGSDAIVHALERVQWADRCYAQILYDLEQAADEGLRTDDLFFHQTRLIDEMHDRDPSPSPGADDTAATDSHPPARVRRQQARAAHRPTDFDLRDAWTLFSNPQQVRQTITDRVYRQRWTTDLERRSAADVQAFLDGEHSEVLLSEQDQKVYGHRFVEPGDLASAVRQADQQDWSDEQLQHQLEQLTQNDYREAARLVSRNLDAPSDTAGDDHRWLTDWDRRLLVAMLCAARRQGEEAHQQLVRRYSFHLHLQDSVRWLRGHTPLIDSIAATAEATGHDEYDDDELLEVLRPLYKGLQRALTQGPETPSLHGLSPGQPLSMVVQDSSLPGQAPLDAGVVGSDWLDEFIARWRHIDQRLRHLRWKSLGALLLYQRQLVSPLVPPE